ncbi:MAG: hypothetical protein QOD06_135 [Candidatus Binatota bacterium]|jgi:acyl carrier protein|nr:hypothetical protein [Candidatus Binatota bacterium]
MRAVTREEVDEVYPIVASTIADALGRDAGEVRRESLLIEDLGAESIDFLDIVFRLERAFHIKIPRGQIEKEARGGLADAEFEQKGVLTGEALARLREYLCEVPADRFRPGLKLTELPLLFTVETFCKVVVRARGDGRPPAARD